MKKAFEQAQRRKGTGMQYKHDLGQNFLYDEALLRHLAASTGVGPDDCVLEIGAGAGTLTRVLGRIARQVVAIEVDEAVMPLLRVAVEDEPNITLVQGDVRRLDLSALTKPFGQPFFVIANIPYNITSPILHLFWGSSLPVKQLSLMVQKEVADKLLALPGDDAYGLPSALCRYYCEPELEQIVPAAAFTPPPKVDSAFVHLRMRPSPPLPVADEKLLLSLMKAGFALRRKTLVNALGGMAGCSADTLRELLGAQGLSPTVRGEALCVEQWITLANACAEQMEK